MTESNIDERAGKLEREISVLLDKYNLRYITGIKFPIYRILPEEVKLALIILKKHGVEYHIGYQEATKKE